VIAKIGVRKLKIAIGRILKRVEENEFVFEFIRLVAFNIRIVCKNSSLERW
jgi:hypothetical protein